jgi:Protein of unknown function (DUF642)
MIKIYAPGVAALSLALVSVSRANILVNGGLETLLPPTMPDDLVYASTTLNTGALPGWSITSGSVDVVPSNYFASSQGSYSVDLVGTPGIGAISQTFATTPGVGYLLTFDFSVNPDSWIFDESGTIKRLQVSAIGTDGLTVLTSSIYSGSNGTRTNSNMQYLPETFSFIADGTSTTLKLEALAPLNMTGGMTANNIYAGPVIDNLDLEIGGGATLFPEPSTLMLLSIGSVVLLKRRARF